jgi:hypothetical protein
MDIYLRYYNPALKIGLADLKSVWLLEGEPVQLLVTVYRGNLVYRMPKTRKRISYRTLKKGLIKTNIVLKRPLQLLPF